MGARRSRTGIDVVIDPGQAFGTGAHHTTRLCLELLLELDPDGALADWGCGSGVLAIAAARLGWDPVLACDWEAASVEATRANAAVNGVPGDRGRAARPAARRGAVGAGRRRQPDPAAAARRRRADDAAAAHADRLRPAARGGRRGGRGVRAAAACARRRGATAANGRRCGSTGSVPGMAWNVLILGGGFGGLTAARRLERKLAPAQRHGDARQRRQLHALHAAAAGRRGGDARAAPRRRPAARAAAPHPAAPRRGHRRRPGRAAWCRCAALSGRARGAALRPADRRARLDLAHAADPRARRARARLQDAVRGDRAAQPRDPARSSRPSSRTTRTRGARCSRFVFVGAGYAGLEGLAELQDFAADVIERYPRARLDGVRFMLVEAKDRVMPEIPPTLAAFASAELRKRGIEVRTSTTIEAVTERHRRRSSGGEVVPARTRRLDRRRQAAPGRSRSSGCRSARAAGSPPTATARCQGRRASGRSATPPASRTRRRRASPSPPTAQHVLRQAKVVADNVVAALTGDEAQAAAVPLPDARRVRRHGPQPGGGQRRSGSAGAASRRGSSPARTTWR